MTGHLLAIPTNRLSEAAISSLGEEARRLESFASGPITLAVIDEGGSSVQEHNRTALALAAKGLTKTAVLHVPAATLDSISSECMSEANFDWPPEDPTDSICYGRAANRLTILATLLNADYVHRRDSDVALSANLRARAAYPIEVEARFLGKTVSETEALPGSAEHRGQSVLLVGGGYTGAWAVRFEELAEQDLNAVHDLIHLVRPWAKRSDIEKSVDERFVKGCQAVYDKDEFAFLKDTFIEGGNMAIERTLFALPFSPAIGVSGTDYLYHAVLNRFGQPMLSHNRRLHHEHGAERATEQAQQSYQLLLARYRCAARYYSHVYQALEASAAVAFVAGELNTSLIADAIERASELDLVAEEHEVLTRLVEIFTRCAAPQFRSVGAWLESKRGTIVGRARGDLRRHGRLIRAWRPFLSAVAQRELRSTDDVQVIRRRNYNSSRPVL